MTDSMACAADRAICENERLAQDGSGLIYFWEKENVFTQDEHSGEGE